MWWLGGWSVAAESVVVRGVRVVVWWLGFVCGGGLCVAESVRGGSWRCGGVRGWWRVGLCGCLWVSVVMVEERLRGCLWVSVVVVYGVAEVGVWRPRAGEESVRV